MDDLVLISVLFIVFYVIAEKFPLLSVISYLLLGVLPEGLTERLPIAVSVLSVGLGFQGVDVVLLAMMMAASRKVVTEIALRRRLKLFLVPFGILIGYLCFEIFRNINQYGISAPGEFRFRYMLIFSCGYTAIFFPTESDRRRLSRMIVLFTIPSVLFLWLVIGLLTGWGFGAHDRFIHSSLSLALAESILALFLLRRSGIIRMSNFMFGLAVVLGLLLIVIDGHRSVWLCIFAMGIVLFSLREVRLTSALKKGLPVIVLSLLIAALVFGGWENILAFFQERSRAYFAYEEDYTASWRASVWLLGIERFLEDPVFGEGFGAYWSNVIDPQTGASIDIFVHSYYVMSLVKLGTIGLAILLWFAYRLWKSIHASFKQFISHGDGRVVYCTLAIVSLVSIHVYGIAYGLEDFSWLFLGIGVSAVCDIAPVGTIEGT